MDTDDARAALVAWRATYPDDPFAGDHELRAVLAAVLPADRLVALEARASAFARQVTGVVGPAARRYEQHDHLPELARWDGLGHRTEAVEFDPAYHEAGRAVWASGLVALSGTPGSAFEQATLLYLLSLEGEAGHACPATCTIGLARALRRAADGAVRDRFLPDLVDPDYATATRASQFLTEVQGAATWVPTCAPPCPPGTEPTGSPARSGSAPWPMPGSSSSPPGWKAGPPAPGASAASSSPVSSTGRPTGSPSAA